MKQIVQNLKSGQTSLEQVPTPKTTSGKLLIRTTHSLVSLGTERMLVEFGKASLLDKARQQPDKVKMVLDKIKTDGVGPTLQAVKNKLDQPLPLGYCNVGQVIEIGANVEGFNVGDRVVSNGPHAEYVLVAKNLVAKIPDNVSDEEATFTVLGAIGLQGIRLLSPAFGETVAVIGLGLIGLITAQLLISSGCRVIGFDIDETKVALANKLGIKALDTKSTDPVSYMAEQTGGIGSDGVIITASSKGDSIISQSARMSRKRGSIVLVGVVDLNISRTEFYEKELKFQVSCSYGPGRYDAEYEGKGRDYPLPYVRWTENRNFQAVLHAISSRNLKVQPMITEVVDLENALDLYESLGHNNSIASIIRYPATTPPEDKVTLNDIALNPKDGIIGIIGAGGFTSSTLLPILNKLNSQIKYIVSEKGLSGTRLATRYNIQNSTTSYKNALEDPEVDTLIVTTRHNQHANIAIEALLAKKNVFIEKPLAINPTELEQLLEVYHNGSNSIMVGFNRRFSPFSAKMKELIGGNNDQLNMVVTINAGYIPDDLWLQDMEIGGGRIIGEACHFLDLMVYFSGSPISSVVMSGLGANPKLNTDNALILVKHANGAQGTINYLSNGNKAYSKERIELYFSGKILVLDNFRSLKGYGFEGFKSMKQSQNKGHFEQFSLLTKRIRNGGGALIDIKSLVNVTKASFAALESLQKSSWIDV